MPMPLEFNILQLPKTLRRDDDGRHALMAQTTFIAHAHYICAQLATAPALRHRPFRHASHVCYRQLDISRWASGEAAIAGDT